MTGTTNGRPVAYLVHDPVTCKEAEITSFDKDDLLRAEMEGMTLIAVQFDGSRSVVHARDVEPPDPITLVTSDYVDARMNAVLSVLVEIERAVCGDNQGDQDSFARYRKALEELTEIIRGKEE